MKCTKELQITIASEEPPITCPQDFDYTLTASSPVSKVSNMWAGTSPHYAARQTWHLRQGMHVVVDFGEPGFGGTLDTILFALYNITATSGSTTTLTLAGANWAIDCFAFMDVYFVGGAGDGTMTEVLSNTRDTITFNAPLGFSVDATSQVSILVAQDDDSGPGRNSQIDFYIPYTADYVFEGSTYDPSVTGDVSMHFNCDCVFAEHHHITRCGQTIGISEVYFDDQSHCGDAWDWDFGDGSPIDHHQNTSHVYAESDQGLYGGYRNVSFTVHCGASSVTVLDQVHLLPKLKINGYGAAFFTPVPGVCPAGGDAWDGTLLPFLICDMWTWTPWGGSSNKAVSINGIGMNVWLIRSSAAFCAFHNGDYFLEFQCPPGGSTCPGITPPGVAGVAYQFHPTDIFNPTGIYTRILGDRVTAPDTLEIALA